MKSLFCEDFMEATLPVNDAESDAALDRRVRRSAC